MEKTIYVYKLTGENACTMQSGNIVYKILLDNFKVYRKVILDFDKIVHVTSSFFNASISRLLKDMSVDELKSKLTIIGLNNLQSQLLNLSIHNAIAFYKGGYDGTGNK